MNQILVGYGQIGKAVYEVIGGPVFIIDHTLSDVECPFDDIEVMHVCIPYSDGFIKAIDDYVTKYSPKHVIIYSTLPIGTTKRIMKAVHSPVEGKHPQLELSIRKMERWIGCNDASEGEYFKNYFEEMLSIPTRVVESSDYTEALKLLSTTEYGVSLVYADYKARVAKEIGMDFELTKQWNSAYNELYKKLHMDDRFQKFVLDPPGGFIGGHCVTPNAKLLNEQFPDKLVKRIVDMS